MDTKRLTDDELEKLGREYEIVFAATLRCCSDNKHYYWDDLPDCVRLVGMWSNGNTRYYESIPGGYIALGKGVLTTLEDLGIAPELARRLQDAEREIERLKGALRDCANEAHSYGLIKHHADPNDRWNVNAIETCIDPACVEACRLLAPTAKETT